MRDRPITVKVDAEFEERLRAAADKDRRTLSDFVRLTLIDALAAPKQPTEKAA